MREVFILQRSDIENELLESNIFFKNWYKKKRMAVTVKCKLEIELRFDGVNLALQIINEQIVLHRKHGII